MRPIVMALLVFLTQTAMANNTTIWPQTMALQTVLAQASTPSHRLQILSAYQDFLFNEMQSPRVDPRSADFADLNEFESDILDFHFKTLSAASCAHNRSHLLAASGVAQEGSSANSAGMPLRRALQVLSWICAGVQ